MSQTEQWETQRITFSEAQVKPQLVGVIEEVMRRLASQGVSERDFRSMSPAVQEAAWDLALESLQEEAEAEGRSLDGLMRRKKVGRPHINETLRSVDAAPTTLDGAPNTSEVENDAISSMEAAPEPRQIDTAEHPQRLRKLYEGCRDTGAMNEAMEWLRAAASAGDARSQAELAMMYASGENVQMNQAEANRWNRVLAQASVSTIQRLPEELRRGQDQFRIKEDEPPPEGLPQEIHRVWRAANDGCSASQAHMAGRFSRGDGVKQDWKKAAYWHERAASSGLAENQYRLGLMYLHGRGVERSPARASEWFQRAKDNPSVSDAWATETARLIRASAALELSQILLKGDGVPANPELAVVVLEEAERAGSRAAADELGRLYFHGKLVARNVSTAVYWFRRGAEGDDGHPPAKLHLAKCYWAGEGVKRDAIQALRWLKSAAEHTGRAAAEAMYLIGWFSEKGIAGPTDTAEALRWYYRAAGAGNIEGAKKVREFANEISLTPVN